MTHQTIAQEIRRAFINRVRDLAMEKYEEGGDIIVECLTDQEIIERFDNIEQAKEFMELQYERRREIESTIW